MSAKIQAGFGIAIAILLGFVREFLFENINTHLYFLRQNEENPYLPEVLSFMDSWTFTQTYYTKYPLMIAFIALNLLICVFTWRKVFSRIPVKRWSILAYTTLFSIGALIFLLGFPFGAEHTTYAITRQLVEPLQSPLGIFILGVGFYVHRKFAL